MRAVVQRVKAARVVVGDEVCGEIAQGLLVLAAVGARDTVTDFERMAAKLVELRIFNDEEGKFNRSVRDVAGSLLVVSQFTLYGDVRRGRRPGFSAAAPPDQARALFEQFIQILRTHDVPVALGRFQESMQVELTNDGPVTILIDTERTF